MGSEFGDISFARAWIAATNPETEDGALPPAVEAN
jgi:hypothetical protein